MTIAICRALLYATIDSTTSQTLAINLKLATATDTVALESAQVELLPGVP